MVYIVYIKHNNMEMKKKKKVLVLYPSGNYLYPTTGGELYDSYLFKRILFSGQIDMSFFTKDHTRHINKWLLPAYILWSCRRIGSYDAVFLNSSWFAQSIWLLYFFRIFYPKLKVYVIHHHFRYQEMSGIKRLLHYMLEWLGLGVSFAVITPNPYTHSLIKQMRPDSRTVFLEMAFKKDVPTSSCYVLKRLLFVGTVYQRKGLLYLLEAIGQMSEKERSGIHLDIVGDLSYKKYYKRLLSLVHLYGLEDVVTFVGRISDEELKSYYSRAYCFVFPSLLEGYGMVLIEAMSYGLPVIAFDNSAIPFTVKNDRNGILVRDKNILDLKKSILKLCVDTDYHRKLCDGALDTYRNARSLSDLDVDIENFVIKELIN